MQTASQRERDSAGTYTPPPRYSRPASPFSNSLSFANIMSSTDAPASSFGGVGRASRPGSGYVTPKEAREEAWKMEAEEKEKLTKNEMREMYKELGGRKARSKGKFGAVVRDKGGWDAGGDFDY